MKGPSASPMSSRTTRSARSSKSVGSRLMMTRVAPARFAVRGNPAAGHTTNDDPIATKRLQLQANFSAPLHGFNRHRLAEGNGGGFDVTTAVAVRCAIAVLEFFSHPWQLVALAAVKASGVGRVAMQLDDVLRCNAGCLMKIVNVLRDQPRHLARTIETRDRPMAAAGLCPAELVLHSEAPAPGLVPHLLIRHKSVEGDRLVLRPYPAGRTKVGDTALRRDPRPGEWDDLVGLLDQIAEARDCRWKIRCDHSYSECRLSVSQ